MYISDLQAAVITAKLNDDKPMKQRREMPQDDPRRLRETIASKLPPPVEELVSAHKTRLGSKSKMAELFASENV